MKRTVWPVLMAVVLLLAPAVSSPPAAATGVSRDPIEGRSVHNDVYASANWSGYAVEASSPFTNAAGTWTQPSAACTSLSATYAAFWVGLDGFSSRSVEQLGTDADCASGRPVYYAWYEMYPARLVVISTTTFPVQPGDTLTASVSQANDTYALSLQSSRGWTFTTSKSGIHANSSAEWISEAPQICTPTRCRGAKLTNFGSVTFSAAQAAAGGAAQPIAAFGANSGPHQIVMATSRGTIRAQPGAITSGGSGFTDTWVHS